MGEVFNHKRSGYFVDIGAHDGITISNTYLLEKRLAWDGLLIEANPKSYEMCRNTRNAKSLNICLDRENGEVQFEMDDVLGGIVSSDTDNVAAGKKTVTISARRFVEILDEQSAPRKIEYLSIDVEGAEERVLGGFDFDKYQFTCFTIERPSEALRKEFEVAGYEKVKEVPGLDSFYVHQSFLDAYANNTMRHFANKRISFPIL
ncbi:FkbM family methyltransferase [Ruegeria profundi]|uniref:FkbM family methyltransferase n=1 Tax=Ruegeria profundi TaxID=1685378 RepID=UPI003C7AD3E9